MALQSPHQPQTALASLISFPRSPHPVAQATAKPARILLRSEAEHWEMRNSNGERIPLLKNPDGSGMLNNWIIYAENNTQSCRGESYQNSAWRWGRRVHQPTCVFVLSRTHESVIRLFRNPPIEFSHTHAALLIWWLLLTGGITSCLWPSTSSSPPHGKSPPHPLSAERCLGGERQRESVLIGSSVRLD